MSDRGSCLDDGSTLTEVLLAAGLLAVALGMLGGSVLAPLATMMRPVPVDDRQVALELAGDTVVRLVLSARPGLDAPAILSAAPDRLELRVGDLREARRVVLVLRDGTLAVELPDGPLASGWEGVSGAVQPVPGTEAGIVIGGIGTAASAFVVRASDGTDATTGPAVAAVVELTLEDPSAPDGSPGRRAERTVHLRLHNPLSAAGRP